MFYTNRITLTLTRTGVTLTPSVRPRSMLITVRGWGCQGRHCPLDLEGAPGRSPTSGGGVTWAAEDDWWAVEAVEERSFGEGAWWQG